MSDPSTPPPALRLGKQPPKHDPRTLQLSHYLMAEADDDGWIRSLLRRFRWRHHRHPHPTPPPPNPNPPPAPNPPPNPGPAPVVAAPSTLNETTGISHWDVLGNADYGDCVEAAMAHVVQVFSKLAQGAEVDLTLQDVLAAYAAITGFNPNDPSTDQGTNMLDALNYWRHTGIAGHRIAGFVQFNPKNVAEWELANYLFGAAFVGVAMPRTAQAQSKPGGVWTVVSTAGDGAPGSWGGHCIPFFDYEPQECVTWGFVQQATWAFIGTYCDEAYVVLSDDWFDKASAKSPAGFDLAALQADLAQFH